MTITGNNMAYANLTTAEESEIKVQIVAVCNS